MPADVTASPVRQAGFTLLEVLAAFIVFALTLAALLQVFSSGLRDAQLADEYARATLIAQSRLSAFTAEEKISEGQSSGFDAPFRWEVKAGEYDERQESAEAAAQGEFPLRVRLLRVESNVRWAAADGRERDVRLATLILAPKP